MGTFEAVSVQSIGWPRLQKGYLNAVCVYLGLVHLYDGGVNRYVRVSVFLLSSRSALSCLGSGKLTAGKAKFGVLFSLKF